MPVFCNLRTYGNYTRRIMSRGQLYPPDNEPRDADRTTKPRVPSTDASYDQLPLALGNTYLRPACHKSLIKRVMVP